MLLIIFFIVDRIKNIYLIKNCLKTHNIRSLSYVDEGDENHFRANVFTEATNEVTEFIRQWGGQGLSQTFERMLEYNQSSDPHILPADVSKTFRQLAKKEAITEENIRCAHYLNWTIQTIQKAYTILDDAVDKGMTRYGRPCWYLQGGANFNVLNDIVLMEEASSYILQQKFKNLSLYTALMDMVNEVKFITKIGQSLDKDMASKSVEQYNIESYRSIALNKIGYGLIHGPLICGMLLANVADDSSIEQLKLVTFKMAEFFQVRNDYLDCYGDPDEIGKVGTDIQEGKCTWLAIKCGEKASQAQKELLVQCYGSYDAGKVEQVKELYNQLNLIEEFNEYKQHTFDELNASLQNVTNPKLQQVLFNLFGDLLNEDMKKMHS